MTSAEGRDQTGQPGTDGSQAADGQRGFAEPERADGQQEAGGSQAASSQPEFAERLEAAAQTAAPVRPRKRRTEAHGHQHRDVSGGWLRPAVFGAMDGLVTNVSLIAGVGGGGVSRETIVLTGLAGLAAGAFSMATGEYVSVSSQNELVAAEVSKEKYELEHNPEAERRELAAVLRHRGLDADLADQVATQVSHRPEEALRMHVREELGVDHQELPSPYVAAGASLATFAVGALIPLLPYLFGFDSLLAAVLVAAVAAVGGGGFVARLTERPVLRGAVRQLLLAGAAAAITYGIGSLVHATVH